MQDEEPTITKEKTVVIQFPVSRREWFAGMAMTGVIQTVLQAVKSGGLKQDVNENVIASQCFTVADAMIEEAKK